MTEIGHLRLDDLFETLKSGVKTVEQKYPFACCSERTFIAYLHSELINHPSIFNISTYKKIALGNNGIFCPYDYKNDSHFEESVDMIIENDQACLVVEIRHDGEAWYKGMPSSEVECQRDGAFDFLRCIIESLKCDSKKEHKTFGGCVLMFYKKKVLSYTKKF